VREGGRGGICDAVCGPAKNKIGVQGKREKGWKSGREAMLLNSQRSGNVIDGERKAKPLKKEAQHEK